MSDGIGRFSRADAPGEAVELTPQLFKQIIHTTLDERDRLDSETHQAHHRWIEAQLKRDEERAELYRQLRVEVARWGLLGLLGWGMHWIWTRVGLGG